MTTPFAAPGAAQTSGATTGLSARGLSKRFAGVRALDAVDFDIEPGLVTALMGENGAGKSTMLKIIGGDYQPDGGRLLLGGREVAFRSPDEARRAGVRIVAQEPEILPSVTVAENIFLGSLPTHRGRVSQRLLRRRAGEELERLGMGRMLDPGRLGGRLSPAQRQLVEIARCLIDDPPVVCFDEPTSSLSDHEIDALFALIARLRDDGRAIAYVSHRLGEIFRIADRVTVLRDGKLIGTRDVAETTSDELVRMMVGRDLSQIFHRERREPGPVALELRDVTTDDVRGVDLTVHAGEVVALAGLVGAGRSELAMALAGDVPVRSGQVLVDGKALRFRDPGRAIAAGIGLAPEERKADALVMVRNVRENLSLAVLGKLSRATCVDRRAERALVRRYIDKLRVRTPSMERAVENLSGGNQQKVVLARWLAKGSRILILDEPTRGVDVGAKAEIYAIIDELVAEGAAVLLISSELPEVLGLADRIVVMQAGEVTGTLTHHEATEEGILKLAMASELTGERTSS